MLAVAAPATAQATGKWTAGAPLNVGRSAHTMTELPSGKVLAVGGWNRLSGPLAPIAAAELFDPPSGTWTLTGMLASARAGHTSTLLAGPNCALNCGKVLVAGGSGQSSAELYDPLTGMWSATGAMTTARTWHTATLLPDGKVLVAGGLGADAIASAELYDPAAGTWSATGTMAIARADHTATRLADGRVLVVGGRGTGLGELAATELYDPAGNQWGPAGALAVPRAFHTATPLADGRVLVAGGRGGTPITPRRSVEIFDPAGGPTSGWSATASMAVAHSGHVAARLPDGSVVVAGGGAPQRAELATAERYDPVAASWRYTGSLTAARGVMGSVALSGPGCTLCGQVLVAGGSRQQDTQFLDATELYDPAAATSPGRVTDLSASAASASVVRLSFSAPPSLESFPPPASRFAIRQASAPISDGAAFDRAAPLCGGVCTFGPAAIGDQLTLDVTDLSPGTTYHYALRALDDGNGIGELSNGAAATTHGGPPPAPVAADAITNLAARALSARSVQLTFGAPGAGGVAPGPSTDYEIRQATTAIADQAGYEQAMALCGGVCRFAPAAVGAPVALTVTGLDPNRTYYYAARARTADGQLGARSNVVTVRTRRDRIAPGRVRFLRPRILRTRVTLRFEAVGSDATKAYPVRRYMLKQASRPITTARGYVRASRLCPKGGCRFVPRRVGQVLTLTVTRLRPGRAYHFSVRAQDGAGNWGPRSRSLRVRTVR